jgi:hypothetical protein
LVSNHLVIRSGARPTAPRAAAKYGSAAAWNRAGSAHSIAVVSSTWSYSEKVDDGIEPNPRAAIVRHASRRMPAATRSSAARSVPPAQCSSSARLSSRRGPMRG